MGILREKKNNYNIMRQILIFYNKNYIKQDERINGNIEREKKQL